MEKTIVEKNIKKKYNHQYMIQFEGDDISIQNGLFIDSDDKILRYDFFLEKVGEKFSNKGSRSFLVISHVLFLN